ncbi:MAG: cellobiose phosphorylase [Candidatus Riflebacteria bacterium]|nr:cellobiose phosphorylase [Candidatus Riflebacteria bacterium]
MNGGSGRYRLDEKGRFEVDNYNWAKPFSSYLPGIAGLWGIPMWVFYVNRGQAVSSAGVRDKDHQLIEFQSFTNACQAVSTQGFRTFLRTADGRVYEPFRRTTERGVRQSLVVTAGEVGLREQHARLGLALEVDYFTLPHSILPGLVRLVTLRNLTAHSRRHELVDGLPRLLPFGMDQRLIKSVARHFESMMGVFEHGGVPLYRLKQTPADTERISRLEGGNFYAAFDETGSLLRRAVIHDADAVFGSTLDRDQPWVFAAGGVEAVRRCRQVAENRTPCALLAHRVTLRRGETARFAAIVGTATSEQQLTDFLRTASRPGFLAAKRAENQHLVDDLRALSFTAGGQPAFDAYAGQNFLDNVIRGGLPLSFDTARGPSAFYVYSRQNGDPERDYHYFVLESTYLSQGTGHYRSVLQNRRCDSWFFPEIGDANLVTFLNLLQTDGYNPLEVNGLTYAAVDLPGVRRWLARVTDRDAARDDLLELVRRPFTPGQLVAKLDNLPAERDRLSVLKEFLSFCQENDPGGLHEGYWIDHWHYNLDLLDTFLAIFPDRLRALLAERTDYTFYDNPDVVLPRAEKFQLVRGVVRQYGAVFRDPEKQKLLAGRESDPARVRTLHGKGRIYRTNLLVKLLVLAANRLAVLDPTGVGLEMEADKPGWADAMNGLPGLNGSSLCETLELLRLCRFLEESLRRPDFSPDLEVPVFEELAVFLRGLHEALGRRLRSGRANAPLAFWEESHTLLEKYRADTRLGLSGREEPMQVRALLSFLQDSVRLLDGIFHGRSRRRVLDARGIPHTYFINEVVKWQPLTEVRDGKRVPRLSRLGNPLVRPVAFRQRPVTSFLEGPVHYLKVRRDEAAEVYDRVRASGLFDKKLRMYRCCEPLDAEPFEIGRITAYPRGWIENEAVYLHMEYKYLLEVLRSGLYDPFFRDLKTMLVCFLDPAVYGRSILEGASFIASSANADPKLHGQAFQPRQSGITCEMVHIWTVMVAGQRPFFLDGGGRLALGLRPVLKGSFFTRARGTHDGVELPAGAFAFRFLGKVLVVYHNSRRRDTFGPQGVQPVRHRLTYVDGRTVEVPGEALEQDAALDVREGRVARIDVTLERPPRDARPARAADGCTRR